MVNKIIEFAISLVISAIPWFVPDCSIEYKIIASLGVFIVFLLLQVYGLTKTLNQVKQDLQTAKEQCIDREKRHKALAAQFELKNSELKQYSDAFTYIGQVLTLATLTPKEAKLKNLLEIYLLLKYNLTEGEENNE